MTNVHGSALKDAYEAGILHRDFSVGNIIMDGTGKGLLIDWDLSKPVSLDLEIPRHTTRTVRISTLCNTQTRKLKNFRVPGNSCPLHSSVG